MPDRDPVPLTEALEVLRSQLGLPTPAAAADLETSWPELVGPEIAAHSRVGGLREGILVVIADSPGWAAQLRYLEAQVTERAAALLGPGAIVAMRIRVDS